MTRPSPILICPMVALRQLPDAERDVLRRFFTEHVRGMDPTNHQRWTRFVRDLFNADPGEGFQIARFEERGGPFHRMHRLVLTRLWEHQDHYPNEDALHDWLKLNCWFVEWIEGKPKPRSTAFDKCSEDEIREFHDRMAELLRQPWCQLFFWPEMRPPQRGEMAEFVLSGKEQST
jgi:hypothetical protein